MTIRATLATFAFAASIFTSGCVVRTGRTHQGLYGHPERANDRHCHERGGKHEKVVCHQHPHGPDHHG